MPRLSKLEIAAQIAALQAQLDDQDGGSTRTRARAAGASCCAGRGAPRRPRVGATDGSRLHTREHGPKLAEPHAGDVPNLDRVERLPDGSHWVHHDEAVGEYAVGAAGSPAAPGWRGRSDSPAAPFPGEGPP